MRCIETDDLFISIRVLQHYKVRVDPRSCNKVPIQVECLPVLAGGDGKRLCLDGVGIRFPESDALHPSLNATVARLKEELGMMCDVVLEKCRAEGGMTGKQFVIPFYRQKPMNM